MSTATAPASGLAGLRAMSMIEARRLARHPVFLVGVVLAFGVMAIYASTTEDDAITDLLAMPIIPAFFIGLTSLVAATRLTRSADAAVEAVATAPGTEARRTLALATAGLVPFLAGLAFVVAIVVTAEVMGTARQEWWFATLPDWQVVCILLALGPVACLGASLLGVLTGRWLRFPGSAAVVVVALVVVTMAGQLPIAEDAVSEWRLWVPWAMFHSGSLGDGTQVLYAGNPAAYLGYLLALCTLAVLVAAWHDRTARTPRLRVALVAAAVVGAALLALAITTGSGDNRVSDPIPFKVSD